jgi:hypothetical protein
MPATLIAFSRSSSASTIEKICKLCIAGFIGLTGLFQTPAHADNNYFGIHGPSYHDGGQFNNANYGLYLVHQGFTGGFYDNSLNRQTFYLGYAREWDLPSNPLIDSISLMGSLATGYYTEQTPYEWMPMGALSFKHSFDSQQGLRLSYLPGVGKSPANYVLHLSYEFRLK